MGCCVTREETKTDHLGKTNQVSPKSNYLEEKKVKEIPDLKEKVIA